MTIMYRCATGKGAQRKHGAYNAVQLTGGVHDKQWTRSWSGGRGTARLDAWCMMGVD